MSNDYYNTGLNSLQRSEIGETRFLYEATKLGWMVGKMPQGCIYDFVADTGKKLLRVQVKTRVMNSKGIIPLNFKPAKHHKYNHAIYTKDNIDAFAIYCPDLDQLAFILSEKIDWDAEGISFRSNILNAPSIKRKRQWIFEDYLMSL